MKRTLLLGSGLGFVVFKWANVMEALQYFWSCYVSKKHNQPFDTLAEHYNFGFHEIGIPGVQFAIWMMAVEFCYRVICLICLIWPAHDNDELSLEYRLKKEEEDFKRRRDKIVNSGLDRYVIEQNSNLCEQMALCNNCLARFQDMLVVITAQIDALEAKQRPKPAKKQDTPEPDLFETAPPPANPIAKAVKAKWGIRKPRRGPPDD